MFKNRSFNVRMVKDQDNETASDRDPFMGPVVAAAYAEVLKDVVTHTALTVGGVWAACKIVGRICK